MDVGAAATKVVLLDHDKNVVGFEVERTGVEASEVAKRCRDKTLDRLGLKESSIRRTASTGYAREDVGFSDLTRTEISCHSAGCMLYFSGPITIVDIGGQDNKIIHLDENGRRTGFRLNRKCAAGTGSFLEEIAAILNKPLEGMNELAEQSTSPVKLGSFCTVFTKTEILSNFRRGDRIPDIAAGAYESIVRRILEMDPLVGEIALTGGVVEHNPYIIGIFERELGVKPKVPPHPQLIGAIGAALFAMEEDRQDSESI